MPSKESNITVNRDSSKNAQDHGSRHGCWSRKSSWPTDERKVQYKAVRLGHQCRAVFNEAVDYELLESCGWLVGIAVRNRSQIVPRHPSG